MSYVHKQYFNELAGEWDSMMNQDPQLKDHLKEFGITSGDSVLDLGAGTGRMTVYLSQMVGAKGRVICEDIAVKMLLQAKQKIKEPNTVFMCEDVCSSAVKDNTVDKALLFSIFPHIKNPLQALREIKRTLKSGGSFLVLHVESSSNLNKFHKELNTAVSADILPAPQELSHMAESVGLKIVRAFEREDLYWVEGRKV